MMSHLPCSMGLATFVVSVLCLLMMGQAAGQKLIFSEEFDELDYDLWQHERTMSGGGVSEMRLMLHFTLHPIIFCVLYT